MPGRLFNSFNRVINSIYLSRQLLFCFVQLFFFFMLIPDMFFAVHSLLKSPVLRGKAFVCIADGWVHHRFSGGLRKMAG